MHKSAVPLVRFLIPVTVLLMALSCLALTRGVSLAAPAAPVSISPETDSVDVSVNPTLEASAYSGSPGHQATQWQIDGSSDFSSPEWTRVSLLPETQVLVNAANGTFANGCAGRSSLEANMAYFWRVRYQDTGSAWSSWSGSGFFITATSTWYLAEGSTAGGMETWLLVQNPGDIDAEVDIQLQTDSGPSSPPGLQNVTIPPNSRVSFNVGSYVTTYNVSTRVTATQGTIACERAMYGPGRAWAHDSIGVTSTSPTWYLAEGCTGSGFETWVLVQNPNADQVSVDLSFMTSRGPAIGPQDFAIPAYSRRSFNVGDYVSDWEVSTKVTSTGGGVICERAMYGNGRQWAHDSIGTVSPNFMWFFAEGCAAGDMETWVLVQNPMGYSQKVEFLLMSDEGVLGYIPATVPGNSRYSLNLRNFEVESYSVSITVATVDSAGELITDGAIICERAMYNFPRTWGHDSVGTPYPPSLLWTLPEGSTAGGMETWVLVQNPRNAATSFNMVLMTDSGLVAPPELQNMTIDAFSRRSFNLGNYVNTYDVSAWVFAEGPVVCERSMYGYGHSWAHNSIGYSMGTGTRTASSGTPAPFDAASCSNLLNGVPRLYPR